MRSIIAVLIAAFSAFNGAFLGMYLYSLMGGSQPGLAGSAGVFWAGLAGLLFGVLAGIVCIKNMNIRNRLILLSCLIVGAVSALSWVMFRMKTVQNTRDQGLSEPANSVQFVLATYNATASMLPPETTLGMGIAKPFLTDSQTLYFYGEKSSLSQNPEYVITDSLIISLGQYNFRIDYAPPWFEPEHLKLDYEILLLKTKTITRNYLEVIVNKTTGKSAWISRESAEFQAWPTFLLEVFDVTILDPMKNPIKIKPLLQANKVIIHDLSNLTLSPIAIQGDWMKVSILDDDLQPISSGWILWKSGDKLAVSYSLLS